MTASVILSQIAASDATVLPEPAYIGPGAGIVVLGSFLSILAALASALVLLFTWPFRLFWRAVRGRRALGKAKVKRVVVIGLDGLEPTLVEEYLGDGLLPNLAELRNKGVYARLGTTYPPLSPVAWSSFSTGTNPGKHNIFDFVALRRSDYRPAVSSVEITPPRRTLSMGPYSLPLSKPRLAGLRKSKPFWNVLGESGIFSAVLRVPITFPPDKFRGVQLSAMCVPDLLGTQGVFSHYVDAVDDRRLDEGVAPDGGAGGRCLRVMKNGRSWLGELHGPTNPFRADNKKLRTPFRVSTRRDGTAVLHVCGRKVALPLGAYSDWVSISFPAVAGMKVHGVCRFYLRRLEPGFSLYCTPMQIDPARPIMPVSHPRIFSVYLAKLLGTYATLGLAEDTNALSEDVLDEDAFLAQSYHIHDERERMLRDALDRVRRGAVVCVFDAPDRIQHMFWRFIDEAHPALEGRRNTHRRAIRDMYVRMDETVGRILGQLDADTAVFVLSDHGFKPFRRGVDLNAWLLQQGYLRLKNGAAISSRRYLAEVDWSGTRAFAMGLAGIFINQEGREARGIVAPGTESEQLVEELVEKLTGLRDDKMDCVAVCEAVPREAVYRGPYVDAAPDIVVGYEVNYRVSWGAAVGKCGEHVFTDNTRAWSGDHCMHPQRVPGVLFSNLKLDVENADIVDLAPTALELLGVEAPRYMDGRSLIRDGKP